MRARTRFYIPPLIISFITLMYLVFLIYYDWAISDYQPLNQVIKDMIARNGRWVNWGACATGIGLILGLPPAIILLISRSDEEYFEEFKFDILKAFPSIRGMSLFAAFMIIALLIVSQGGWRLGLRDGLEFIGVIVWFIFLLITSIITPILLVDIFSGKLPKLIFKKVLYKRDTNN